MNKQEMIMELYSKSIKIVNCDLYEYKNMSNWKKTGFIICELLPAIRDTAEFQDGFWAWMNSMGYNVIYAEGNFLIELHNKEFPKTGLLGYELEYAKEILNND